jgi:hypothetical protein
MSGKTFTHRMIITKGNGESVASEVTTNSLSGKNQKKYIESHFRLLNMALGLPPTTTLNYSTDDPREAANINNYINKITNDQ